MGLNKRACRATALTDCYLLSFSQKDLFEFFPSLLQERLKESMLNIVLDQLVSKIQKQWEQLNNRSKAVFNVTQLSVSDMASGRLKPLKPAF